MFKVIGCFSHQHDFKLVALAALICALASVTTLYLATYARRFSGKTQLVWLAVASAAGGSGIWATHFIAMLAFAPGLPSGYDLILTLLSLLIAVLLTAAGLGLSIRKGGVVGACVGGAVLGAGIAAMHYTGMAAYEIGATFQWDRSIVVASILFGAGFGAAALVIDLKGHSPLARAGAPLLLMLAIVSHHFTAMGAVTIAPDPTMVVPVQAMPASWLAIAVALASFVLIAMAAAALWLDQRDRRRERLEIERMNNLANAAVEGLIICSGDRIVNANDSFAELVGIETAALIGRSLSSLVVAETARLASVLRPREPHATELRREDGSLIPVEMIRREIVFAGKPHDAIAVRDTRARLAAERRIEFLAHHDVLTGLPNRASLHARYNREIDLAESTGTKLAVLCLDLDRFKEVNDLFGHAAGDQLLQTVARVITSLLDKTQMMARLGGDEFTIISPVEDAESAKKLAQSVIDALHKENAASSAPPAATSIGIAIYPDDTVDRDALMTFADTALYRSKAEGRGASSSTKAGWAKRSSKDAPSNTICAKRSRSINLPWCFSRNSASRPVRSSPSKLCCDGTIPSAASCRPTTSFLWPRRPASSCRSASGSCDKAAKSRRRGRNRFRSR